VVLLLLLPRPIGANASLFTGTDTSSTNTSLILKPHLRVIDLAHTRQQHKRMIAR
jgi:hypothetical protein